MTPTFPTIHLNGTNKADLLKDYMTALDAVQDALKAFQAIEFNARDYYVDPHKFAFSVARSERSENFHKLTQVQAYLMEIAVHISNS